MTFAITFYFVPSDPQGDIFTRTVRTTARSWRDAMASAENLGFDHFGQLFNDACIDWTVTDGSNLRLRNRG